jgi:hypothetical protein
VLLRMAFKHGRGRRLNAWPRGRAHRQESSCHTLSKNPQTEVQMRPQAFVYACETTCRTVPDADKRGQLRPKLRPAVTNDIITHLIAAGIRPQDFSVFDLG